MNIIEKIKLFTIKNNYYLLILLICVSANLAVYLYLVAERGSLPTSPDSREYLEISHAIRHFSGTMFGVIQTHYKGDDIGEVIMPGYPLLISPFFENLNLIALFQVILLSIGLFYLFKVLNNKYLIIFNIMTSVWIIFSTSWNYHNMALIESPTISSLLIIIYLLDKYFKNFQLKDIIWFSIVFGILISLNNRYIFHYCGFFAFLFVIKFFESKIKIKHLFYSFIIVTAIMTPWHIRQYFVVGKFVLFSPERSGYYNKANETDENKDRLQKITNYRLYLLDSLNHPFKDNPEELEEARRLYFARKKEKKEEFLAMKAAGTVPEPEKQIIIFEPSKKEISSLKKNDLAANKNFGIELIQKRQEILGFKAVGTANGNDFNDNKDATKIIKYDVNGKVKNRPLLANNTKVNENIENKITYLNRSPQNFSSANEISSLENRQSNNASQSQTVLTFNNVNSGISERNSSEINAHKNPTINSLNNLSPIQKNKVTENILEFAAKNLSQEIDVENLSLDSLESIILTSSPEIREGYIALMNSLIVSKPQIAKLNERNTSESELRSSLRQFVDNIFIQGSTRQGSQSDRSLTSEINRRSQDSQESIAPRTSEELTNRGLAALIEKERQLQSSSREGSVSVQNQTSDISKNIGSQSTSVIRSGQSLSESKSPQLAVLSTVKEFNSSGRNSKSSDMNNLVGISRSTSPAAGLSGKSSVGDLSSKTQPQTMTEKDKSLISSSTRPGTQTDRKTESEIKLKSSENKNITPNSELITHNSKLITQNSEFKSPQLAVLSPAREMSTTSRNTQTSNITNPGGITRNATTKTSGEFSSKAQPQAITEKEQSLLSSSTGQLTPSDRTTALEINKRASGQENLTPKTSKELTNSGLAPLKEKERKLQSSGKEVSVSVRNQTSDLSKNTSTQSTLVTRNGQSLSENKSPQLAVLSPVNEMSPSGRNAQSSNISNPGGITRNAGAPTGLIGKPSDGDISSRPQPKTMTEKDKSLISSSTRPGTQTDRTTASEIKQKSSENKNLTPRASEELSNRGLAALIEKERKLQLSGREGSVSVQNQTSDTRIIKNELRRSSTSELKTQNSELRTQHSEKLAVLSPVREMSPSGRNAQTSEITNRGGITRNATSSAEHTRKPSAGDLSSRLQPQTMTEKEKFLLNSSTRPGTQTDRKTESEIKLKSPDNKSLTPRASEELTNRGLAALIEKERKLQSSGTRNLKNELRRSSTSELITHNSEFKTQHSEKLAVLSPVREISPSDRTNSSNTTKTPQINPTNKKEIQTTTANSQNISQNTNQNKQSTNNKPNLLATSTTMKDRAKVIEQEGNKQLKELIKQNNGKQEQLTNAKLNVDKDSIQSAKPSKSVTLKSDILVENVQPIYQAPIIKLDTQVVITKKVVNKPVLLADASSSKPQYKRSIITDTLVVIKKLEIVGGFVKVNNPQKEEVTFDTMTTALSKVYVKSQPQKIKTSILTYQDESFTITIQDMKVQQIKVVDFENSSEFIKFENLRNQKMVPPYNDIVDALLRARPKFAETPEKLQLFLTDFSYTKYKQLVYQKDLSENKYQLVWNRFKEQFIFYDTDFRLGRDWDPRIAWPSHYNNFINWSLEVIMVPLILINIIPLFFAIYKKNWLIISLAVLVFLHILLHALVGYIPRYRITIYPVWITFAVYGYDQITRYLIYLYKNRNEYKLRSLNLLSKFK